METFKHHEVLLQKTVDFPQEMQILFLFYAIISSFYSGVHTFWLLSLKLV